MNIVQSRKKSIAPLMIVALAAAGCKERHPPKGPEEPISNATREMGSTAVPTNQYSVDLLLVAPSTRLATLREVIRREGQQCDRAIAGILLGGAGGDDEWRVTCSNTGDWIIWFRSNGDEEVLRESRSRG